MTLAFRLVALAVLAAGPGTGILRADDAAKEGNVYLPKDGASFEITDRDVVRFTGPSPGSTGFATTVTVTRGDATVTRRPTYAVVMGKPLRVGGGAPEFDVRPVAGKTGVVKVTVTTARAGTPGETKEYEFVVK